MIHSSPAWGSSGSPISRRCSAYSLKASWPAKALRLPYMWSSTKPMNAMPLTAINILSAMVERVERAPLTKALLGIWVATNRYATRPPAPAGSRGSVTNAARSGGLLSGGAGSPR